MPPVVIGTKCSTAYAAFLMIDLEKIREREVNRINELRKQEALERYHALIKYSISHDKRDTVVTIPKYEEIK